MHTVLQLTNGRPNGRPLEKREPRVEPNSHPISILTIKQERIALLPTEWQSDNRCVCSTASPLECRFIFHVLSMHHCTRVQVVSIVPCTTLVSGSQFDHLMILIISASGLATRGPSCNCSCETYCMWLPFYYCKTVCILSLPELGQLGFQAGL